MERNEGNECIVNVENEREKRDKRVQSIQQKKFPAVDESVTIFFLLSTVLIIMCMLQTLLYGYERDLKRNRDSHTDTF